MVLCHPRAVADIPAYRGDINRGNRDCWGFRKGQEPIAAGWFSDFDMLRYLPVGCARNGLVRSEFGSPARQQSHHHLKVDERRILVDHTTDFAVAAHRVKRTGTGDSIPGVEADCVGWPFASLLDRFFQ